MSKKEVRTLSAGQFEVRAEGDDDSKTLKGHAAVFNSDTEIAGAFRERIAPGAFTRAIKEDDVRALFNHDANQVLGRTASGTLRLAEDKTGLAVEIDPPDTQYARDAVTVIERGDVSQMSFGFRVRKETWEEGEEGELDLRTIEEAELFDVSPVTFPAYADTDVAVRSHDDWKAAQEPPTAPEATETVEDAEARQRQAEAF